MYVYIYIYREREREPIFYCIITTAALSLYRAKNLRHFLLPFDQYENDSKKASIPCSKVKLEEAEEGLREASAYTKQTLSSVCW